MNPLSAGMLCYKLGKFGGDLWWGTHAEKLDQASGFIDDFEKSNYTHEPSLRKAISILEQIPDDEKDYIIAGKNYYLALCYGNDHMYRASLRCLDVVANIEIGTFTACADTLASVKTECNNLRRRILELMNESQENYEEVPEDNNVSSYANFSQCLQVYREDAYEDIDTFLDDIDSLKYCSEGQEEVNLNLLAAVACLHEFLGIFKAHCTYQKYRIDNYLKRGIGYISAASNSYNSKEIQIVESCYKAHYNFWIEHNFNSEYYINSIEFKLSGIIQNLACDVFSEEYIKSLYESTLNNILYYCVPTGEEPNPDDYDQEEEYEEETDFEESVDTDSISEEEQEYIDEYREIIADGEISERDRRFLNKIMKANGISEARAKQLEDIASQPALSEGEQEYLEEYRDIISEGEISSRDQRFLDKLKKANGISEARAKELEAMA